MGSDRPIFVVGCPRSGTTLLQLMLHAHPRIAIPPETRFMLAAYQAREEFGDLNDAGNRRALASWIVDRKESKFSDLGLDARQVTEEIVAGPPTLGSALGLVFRAYAQRFDKPRWGDKRPGYYKHVPTLLRLFPDAQIVHLVRDARDCVASLKEMSWWKHDFYETVAAWGEAIDYGRQTARRLPPGSYHELRYEQLVSDPEHELTALCAFLGEEYDPAMSEPRKLASVAVPKRKKWHARASDDVSPARVGSWDHRLEPWELALCESVLGSRLRSYGYELSGAGRPPAEHLARYTRAAAHRKLSVRKYRMADWRERRREPNPVAALLTEAQQSTGRD